MFSTSFLRNILERSINLLCMILFDLDIVFTAIRKYKWISQNTYEKLFGLDHVQVIIVIPTELWKPWQFFFLTLCTKYDWKWIKKHLLYTEFLLRMIRTLALDKIYSTKHKQPKPQKTFCKDCCCYFTNFFVFFHFQSLFRKNYYNCVFTELFSEFGSIILQHFTFFGFWF